MSPECCSFYSDLHDGESKQRSTVPVGACVPHKRRTVGVTCVYLLLFVDAATDISQRFRTAVNGLTYNIPHRLCIRTYLSSSDLLS